MRTSSSQAGAIRIRNLIELTLVFLVVYVVFQAAPVVILRMNFLNELEVIANSPVQESAAVLRRKVLEAAAGRSIVLLSEDLHVQRDQSAGKTTIDVKYELYVNFFPRFTYVWKVHDQVEALLI